MHKSPGYVSVVRSLDTHVFSSSPPAQSAFPSHAFSIEMNVSEPEQKKYLSFTIFTAGKKQTKKMFREHVLYYVSEKGMARFLLKYTPTIKVTMTITQHTVITVNLQRALVSSVLNVLSSRLRFSLRAMTNQRRKLTEQNLVKTVVFTGFYLMNRFKCVTYIIIS